MDLDMNGEGGGNKRVFQRLGASNNHQKVCFHWRAGRCNRYPCPYLHRELPAPPPPFAGSSSTNSNKRINDDDSGFAGSSHRRGGPGSGNNSWGRFGGNRTVTKTEKLCKFWADGNCPYGDKCKYLHCWSQGYSFSLLTQLDGHQKVVTGIALPSGSDKLYTASKMKLSGFGIVLLDSLGGEAGCMISEGPWLLVGMPNLVKAWNIQTNVDLSLIGPVGQVYSLVVATDLLFAGTQDGSVLVWRYNTVTSCFDPAASLTGHTLAVVSLYVGANRLYSVYSNAYRAYFSCHVSHLLGSILLSCSLDNTVKIWAATEGGNLEVTYTHKEEYGVLALCGVHDAEAKPVLLCSCNDKSLHHLYDLPSFSERGKIFAKQEIRSIQIGPGGIFFTGDGTGQVKVWKWSTQPTAIQP
ncbi:hypothetical protein HA466_0233710 [Hirschfeldia incana]|nr:hypothetical protein HA466_0233710 [Hirschfeldia incana]